MIKWTPEQHRAEAYRLLNEAAAATDDPVVAGAMATLARGHFDACQALGGAALATAEHTSPHDLDGEPFDPAAAELGTVSIRIEGSRPDIAGTVALLDLRHIHLDMSGAPQLVADGSAYVARATLDIGAYRALADQLNETNRRRTDINQAYIEGQVPLTTARAAVEEIDAVEQQRLDVLDTARRLGLRLIESHEVPATDVGLIYRDHARVIAVLAALYPSAISANDPTEPGRPILYVDTPRGQVTWYLSPNDLDLFGHVEVIAPDVEDMRKASDGHDAADQHQRLAWLIDDLMRDPSKVPAAESDQEAGGLLFTAAALADATAWGELHEVLDQAGLTRTRIVVSSGEQARRLLGNNAFGILRRVIDTYGQSLIEAAAMGAAQVSITNTEEKG